MNRLLSIAWMAALVMLAVMLIVISCMGTVYIIENEMQGLLVVPVALILVGTIARLVQMERMQ